MSYEKDVKITFYNMEDGEEVSDEYSEFLMINRDGEVFELVHNGRGEYSPSYEGDWIGYKIKGSFKADEYEAKAKALDRIVEQRKKTGVITLGHHAWKIIREYESGEYDAKK